MKLIDIVIIVALMALLALAFYLNRKRRGGGGCCSTGRGPCDGCAQRGQCGHCRTGKAGGTRP